ncbi:hypothetical protein [Streptomyces sp. YIM B13508]|uniref:hypothetical protein n=1 Tax=Streptomyces sp. YIM B13508 TaxID=3366315 RepID=UPI0036B59BF6
MSDASNASDKEPDTDSRESSSTQRDVVQARLSTWVNIAGGLLMTVTATATTYLAWMTYTDDSQEKEQAREEEIEEYGRRVAVYWTPDAGSYDHSGIAFENRNAESLNSASVTYVLAGASVSGSKANEPIKFPSVKIWIGAIPPCSRTILLPSRIMKTEEFKEYMRDSNPSITLREAKWTTSVEFIDGERREWTNRDEDPFERDYWARSAPNVSIHAGSLMKEKGFKQEGINDCGA